MIWFTGDTHFNHKFMSKMRGFSDINEMNKSIINKWNEQVSRRDIVYHLGDFGFGKEKEIAEIRNKLKGKIILILGNHDYKNHIDRFSDIFTKIYDLKTIKYNHKKIILCHYAMRVWDSSHYNSYHLYGHSHGELESWGKSFDVGWDNWHRLLNIEEVLIEFEKCPNNPNNII